MSTATVNGVRIFYETTGSSGDPLVMVHGGWVSHHSWDLVAPHLGESFRVVTYDRRGHSQSERQDGPVSVHDHVADLAALIEEMGLAPAWVGSLSSGASVALRMATERSHLVRRVIAHEPAIFGLLADDPAYAPMVAEGQKRMSAIFERVASGDHAGAAEEFVENIGVGPGGWAQLPPSIQQTFIENALAALKEGSDPDTFVIEPERLAAFTKPVLLTMGDRSPPMFGPTVKKLAAMLPNAEVVVIPGAGHRPQATHPEEYAEAILEFTRKHGT